MSEGNVKQQWIPNTLNPEHPTSSRSPLQQHHRVPLRKAGSCSATSPQMERLVLRERKTCPGQTFFLRAGASHFLAHCSHMHTGSYMNMHFTMQSYPTWCGCGIKTITGLLLKGNMGDIFIYTCLCPFNAVICLKQLMKHELVDLGAVELISVKDCFSLNWYV